MTTPPAESEATGAHSAEPRTRSRYFRRENLATAGIVLAAYLIAYVATLRTKQLFAPDSRYYTAMALHYNGDSKAEAAQQVAAESAKYGWESPGVDLLFGWGLVQPRVVYPALSTPFVKVYGIEGMLVVPGIALGLFVALLTIMLARRWGNVVAIATVLLICTSHYMIFFGAAMLTESLSALWGAILLALVWRYHRQPALWLVAAMVVMTVVSGFTRQATLIPAGAFVSAWVCAALLRQGHRKWVAPALAIGATAVIVQLLQMWLFPGFSQAKQFKSKTGSDTLEGAITGAPQLAWDIVKADVVNMVAMDRPLLLLLALALVSMVVFWRRSESHLLLGALAGYELYNITNGTPTAFRYGMPGLVFVACSVAVLFASAYAAQPRPAEPEPARAET